MAVSQVALAATDLVIRRKVRLKNSLAMRRANQPGLQTLPHQAAVHKAQAHWYRARDAMFKADESAW